MGFRLHTLFLLRINLFPYFICHVEIQETNPSLRPLTACILFQFDN